MATFLRIKPNLFRPLTRSQVPPFARYLTTTTSLAADKNPDPQRDAQHDRHKMSPEYNEYSKSATDASTAKHSEAAFNPNITDPQEAKKKAGEGNKGNPLDASPANPELSKQTREEDTSKG